MDSKKLGSFALLRDFRLLLYLFIGFRLIMMMVYQPMLVDDVERGMSTGGDYYYHYMLAEQSDGLLPYRDYWSEFPPVWPVLNVIVYQVTKSAGEGNYSAYAGLMFMIMMGFDVGNLILMRRIGARVYGRDTGLALAWVYALMAAPLVFLGWNFEPMVAFVLLLSVWWLVAKQDSRSAITAAAGGLVKFVPLVIIGAVWRYRDWRVALLYTLLALGIFATIFGAIIVANGEMGSVSLTAQFGKSSYATVWALLDGNYATGVFGAVEERFDPANAGVLTGNPALIPSWLRLIVFGGIGIYIFAATKRFDDRGIVAFVTITLLIFFLWAQGWSPQWLALIIPLALLAFPSRNMILVLLLLSILAFAEYPMLFMRTGDTGGEVTGMLRSVFTLFVILRTAILAGICVGLYRVLRVDMPLANAT